MKTIGGGPLLLIPYLNIPAQDIYDNSELEHDA